MENRAEEFLESIKYHPYNRGSQDSITTEFHRLIPGMSLYRINQEAESKHSPSEYLKCLTPEFQRENTKWSREMQARFVNNVLAGFRTTILMYSVGTEGGPLDNVYILDGLQRLTAISAFCADEYPIQDEFYFSNLNTRRIMKKAHINVEFHHFNNHKEACHHYIAMNEGITHSPEDLKVAYAFLEQG
mgnify:CR=1 FL=1